MIPVHTSSLMRVSAHALKKMEEGDLLEGCDLLGEAEIEISVPAAERIGLVSCAEDYCR